MTPEETRAREDIASFGALLYNRGLAHGTAGNISVRLEDGYLVTPTNVSMGALDPAQISKLDLAGRHISGGKPTKEAFLHRVSYDRRPQDRAVVHLHCTHCVAVSCMHHQQTGNVLPPLTAYHVMRVGRLPLIPYFRPGDEALAHAVAAVAAGAAAVLLANHGPIVGADALDRAVYAIEELEETSKLYLLLKQAATSPLTEAQIADLLDHFPPS